MLWTNALVLFIALQMAGLPHSASSRKVRGRPADARGPGTPSGGDLTPDELVEFFFEQAQQGLSEPALPPETYTPVGVHQAQDTAGLGGVFVEFCQVQFAEQKADPVRVPFHHNLVMASGCDNPGKRISMSVAELLPAISSEEGHHSSHLWSGLPRGVGLHMARCGSTAVANMIAAAPRTVLLSEPRFVFDALVMGADGQLTSSELTILLRLLAHLTTSGAVELLQATGSLPQGTGAQLFLKMQSNIPLVQPVASDSSSLISLQKAWPHAAWAFVFRHPLEVIAAQLAVGEGSSTVINDAAVSETLALSRIPCLASRPYPGPFIAAILSQAGIADRLPGSIGPAALTAEAYCAAHTGALLKAALNFSDYLQERKQDCAVANHRPIVPGCNSMIFIEHTQLHERVLGQHGLLSHFGIDVSDDGVLEKVVAIGRRNSKNASISPEIGYTQDANQKQRQASHAATIWSELLAQRPFNEVRAAATLCSSNTHGNLFDGDTRKCLQQLPSAKTLSDLTITTSVPTDGDSDRDIHIDLSLGHQMVGSVAPTAACSYESLPNGWPAQAFVHVSEKGMESFTEGDWDVAEACWWLALSDFASNPALFGSTRANIGNVLENLAVLEQTRSKRSSSSPRIWHGKSSESKKQIPEDSSLLGLVPFFSDDRDIKSGIASGMLDGVVLYESQLDKSSCESIIALFESSKDEYYSGNIIDHDGNLAVNETRKKSVEVDISSSERPEWRKWDQALLRLLVTAVNKYEVDYPGYTFLPNPLWDEGFRMKRYDPANGDIKAGHHSWHVDQSGPGCRQLAVLIYLANVTRGGQTLFRTPIPRAIVPREGSILVFPAGPSHLHAGAPPIGGPKYVISNFVATCSLHTRLGIEDHQ